MIDHHPTECRAMALFKQGRGAEASALQDEFLQEVMASGEDHCNCPSACKFHGRCVECVTIHRGHGDHLPYCFSVMVRDRVGGQSELLEHTARR